MSAKWNRREVAGRRCVQCVGKFLGSGSPSVRLLRDSLHPRYKPGSLCRERCPQKGHLRGLISSARLSESLQNRLRDSWAHLLKVEILAILFRCEDNCSKLYGKTVDRSSGLRVCYVCVCFKSSMGSVTNNRRMHLVFISNGVTH